MKRFLLLVLPLTAALYVSAQTNHNGTWYSYYDDNTHTMNTQGDYEHGDVFAPTTGTLNVQWRYEWIDWFGAARKIDTDVLESANNGDNTTQIGSFAENTDKNSNTTESFSISENINWIKYNRSGFPTHKVILYHEDIPLAKHILLASGEYGAKTASHDFGEKELDAVPEEYMVHLRSFLTAGDITVISSDPQNFRVGAPDNKQSIVYAVGANACASANGTASAASGSTLGKISNYDFPVYFTPQKGGTFNGTITISDGTSVATVLVKGSAPKKETMYAYSVTVCEGEVYTDDLFGELSEAGVYQDTIPNVYGGDSVVTLTLDHYDRYAFAEEKEIYVGSEGEWQGVDLALLPVGDTTMVAKYNTVHGCDSTYTLRLTVVAKPTAPTTFGADTLHVCAGESVVYAGKTYKRPATDSVPLENANHLGGDSVVVLAVNVLPAMRQKATKTMVEGDEQTWQDIDLSLLPVGDTTLVAEYSSVYGCDSTYTLKLTVLAKIAQGLDDIKEDDRAEKFFRNGHLYIRKRGRVYNLQGVKVE